MIEYDGGGYRKGGSEGRRVRMRMRMKMRRSRKTRTG